MCICKEIVKIYEEPSQAESIICMKNMPIKGKERESPDFYTPGKKRHVMKKGCMGFSILPFMLFHLLE